MVLNTCELHWGELFFIVSSPEKSNIFEFTWCFNLMLLVDSPPSLSQIEGHFTRSGSTLTRMRTSPGTRVDTYFKRADMLVGNKMLI